MDNTCNVCGEFLNTEGFCDAGCEDFSEEERISETKSIAKKDPMKMIICPKCDSESPWYRTHCDKCKIYLEDAIHRPKMKERPLSNGKSLLGTCQNCQHQFSKRASICPKCNQERTAECCVCKKQIPQSSQSCTECGDPAPFECKIKKRHEPLKQKTIPTTTNNEKTHCSFSGQGLDVAVNQKKEGLNRFPVFLVYLTAIASPPAIVNMVSGTNDISQIDAFKIGESLGIVGVVLFGSIICGILVSWICKLTIGIFSKSLKKKIPSYRSFVLITTIILSAILLIGSAIK